MSSAGLWVEVGSWLEPLRSVLDPGDRVDWSRLADLARALDSSLSACPLPAEHSAGPQRSLQLRAVREAMSKRGFLDMTGQPSLFATLTQFMCGYRDIDLRDTTGLGHGMLIAKHGSLAARQHWIPRLVTGELAGIAITEPHGGSRPAETQTSAVATRNGTWLVTGRKTWISRLAEAAVFVVFFRAPDGRLAAAAVDAAEPGLHRKPIPPAGLAGWSWGVLDLDSVPVRPQDVLQGDGMTLLRNHFAWYRPLVTATALGGAAAMFDTVVASLAARQSNGGISRPRDSALVTIGRTHSQVATALLGAFASASLAASGNEDAERWSAVMKAHGIDAANTVAAELVLLLGASGFLRDCQVSKIRRDLSGLQYADGIHDSLYRSAGKQHIAHACSPAHPRHPRLKALPESA